MKKQFSRSISVIALFLILSSVALAAYIPEPTTMELPDMESLAYRGTPVTYCEEQTNGQGLRTSA